MLNETIKKLLTNQNKTQAELAKFVGVRQNTVSDWLNHNKSPSSAYIYRICDFFGVSFNYLFTGKEEEKSFGKLSEGERDILELVHPLSPKELQRVVGVIENYLGKRQTPQKTLPVSPKPSEPSASTTPSDDEFREQIQENFSDTLELIAKLAK